jgi:two-component system NtrC family response regulator
MELLHQVKSLDADIPFILLTGFGSVSMAVEALKQGAYYFFEKPVSNNLETFLTILRQALKTQQMERELSHLRNELKDKYSFPNIVGQDPRMLELFKFIRKVSQTDNTVLIQGESGTGKDLVARTIHFNSLRSKKPLVAVNCGALTETLFTSEMFGHTKGSFTGAVRDTVGRFQAAEGGTLILEEIGEVPLNLQKVFLRVIEEKELERVGSSQTLKIDVRIIVTTNLNLQEEMNQGTFRKDLFYRLNILSLTIPPLRERPLDIPILVHHFIKKYQKDNRPLPVHEEVLAFLKKQPWFGNIRELDNVVQHLITFCDGKKIILNDLPPYLFENEKGLVKEKGGQVDLTQMVSDLEKKWILEKLKEADGNRQKACQLLGITRRKLLDRMLKYNISTPA